MAGNCRDIVIMKIHRNQNSVSHALAYKGRSEALTTFWLIILSLTCWVLSMSNISLFIAKKKKRLTRFFSPYALALQVKSMDARTHSLRFRPASFLWHDARFRFGDRPTFNGRMHVTVATKLSALLNKKNT